MDTSQQKETLARLEEAVNTWLGQFSDAHRALGDQTSKMREMLDAIPISMSRHRESAKELAQQTLGSLKTLRDSLGGSEDAQRRVAELEEALGKAQSEADALKQRLTALEGDVVSMRNVAEQAQRRVLELEQRCREHEARAAELSGEVESAKADVKSVTLDLEVTLADLGKAREERDAASAIKQEVEQLERLLETERRRCGELEGKLREETTKKTKSALAQQLTEALRETEAAQEEIKTLRGEVTALRGTPQSAPPPVAAPKEEAPKEEAPRKKRAPRGRANAKTSLEDLLVEAGTVTRQQVDAILENERVTPQRHVGVILIEKGLATETDVAQAIAAFCDAESVDLSAVSAEAEAVALLSERLARLHTCLPIRVVGNRIVLAMANPLALLAIEDIERSTNLAVHPVVAEPSQILEAIGRCYVGTSTEPEG